MHCITNAWAIPYGARIDNTATASFHNAVSGADEVIASGLVTTTVQNITGIVLTPSRNRAVTPAANITLSHTLINNQLMTDTISLSLINAANDDFDAANLSIWQDNNTNGQIDSTDTEFGSSALLTLAPLQQRTLLLAATIPGGIPDQRQARLNLLAEGTALEASLTNTLMMNNTGTHLVNGRPSVETVAIGQGFDYRVTFLASEISSVQGTAIQMDGIEQTLVVVETPIPKGSYPTGPVTPPPGFSSLYRTINIDGFTGTFPVEPREVTSVAFSKPSIENGDMLLFDIQLAADGGQRKLPLQTTVWHHDGALKSEVAYETVLVDPGGYVFNSITGSPIINAEVTMYRVQGGSQSIADVYEDENGLIVAPNPTRTDDSGYYKFPYAAAGEYRIVVTELAEGFTVPSARSGAEMDGLTDIYTDITGQDNAGDLAKGRLATQTRGYSYGGIFPLVDVDVFIDIPVDPYYVNDTTGSSKGLGLNVSTDRREANIGDAVKYTLQIQNLSGNEIGQTEPRIELPRGFSYVESSAYWNDTWLDDSAIENNETLAFQLGELDTGAQGTLTFRIAISPPALDGSGIVMARTTASGEAAIGQPPVEYYSQRVRNKLAIDAGGFSDDGLIIGRVFHDCNGNGRQDSGINGAGEAGIPGVRIYLQNGRYVTTDDYGRYSFPRLRPGSYVLKVDPGSTDIPWQLTRHTVRDGEYDDLKLIDLSLGEMSRADFPVNGCSFTEREKLETSSKQSPQPEPPAEDAPPATPILFPHDGSRIITAQTRVELAGPLGLEFTLKVNDEAVSDSRLGEQITDKENDRQQLNYFAINLKPGKNRIEAIGRDPWGNIRSQQIITVTRPGPLAQLHWQASPGLKADGNLHSVQLHLLDEQGLRIGTDTAVTISILDGLELGLELVDTDIDALTPGLQRRVTDGQLNVQIKSPAHAGDIVLQASSGSLHADTTLHFSPKLRNWIAAGVVEGELSRQIKSAGDIASQQEHQGFDGRLETLEREWNGGNNRAAVRGSVFAKGTVRDEYLVTLIADTDKTEDDDWAGRPDLDRDYPIYGDDAENGAEGEAEKGLYLRVEKDDDYMQIGDYRPGQDQRRTRVGAYNHKLYGIQQYYQGKRWQVETFAAQTSTTQIVDFIRARGTSGPYRLSKNNIVQNSQQVEVITRTRAPDGNIVSSEPLQAFIDYEFDDVLGSLLLRAPLAGSDELGRPRYLRVSYSVDEENGLDQQLIGTDISYAINDELTVGARTLGEKSRDNYYSLSSLNALLQMNASTTLSSEYASSRNSALDVDEFGRAMNMQLDHRNPQRNVRLSVSGASNEFENASAAVKPDTRNADFNWQENLSPQRSAWTAARWFRNDESGLKSYAAEIGLTESVQDNLSLGISLEEARSQTSDSDLIGETSLGMHARYRPEWSDRVTLEAHGYQAFDNDRQRQKLGLDYRLPREGSVAMSWERFKGYDINGDLDGRSEDRQRWAMGYRQQVHSTTELYTEYHLDQAADGIENSAATGLRYGYDIEPGLRLIAQAERTLDLADNPGNASQYSWALGISGFKDTHSKWLARIEMAAAEDQRWLQEARWARRLDDGWAILSRERLQWRQQSPVKSAEATVGLAYRPLYDDHWDWLGSYTLNRENLTEAIYTRHLTRNTINLRANDDWTITSGLVVQYSHESAEQDYASLAWLNRLRLRYDISPKWSASVMGSYFQDQHLDTGNHAWGTEVQHAMGGQFVVAVGYQHFDYRDVNVDPDSVYRRGITLRISAKFDERSLDGLLQRLE